MYYQPNLQVRPHLQVRPPQFADNRWYSADPTRLRANLQTFLAPAAAVPQPPVGLIAPHAGHTYSGHVAGAAFAQYPANAFTTVVILCPDHRGAAPGRISTLAVDVWRTPLGDISIDWTVLNAIQPAINLLLLPTDNEHAIEIELPFLQETLHHFQLVPLLMGDQSPATCRRLAAALVKATPLSQTLFVASSDFSHYFDDPTARQLDEATLQFILNLDAVGLLRHVEQGRYHNQPLACGSGPIATVMLATNPQQATLLKYATSADISHDTSRVVGYAAVAFSPGE